MSNLDVIIFMLPDGKIVADVTDKLLQNNIKSILNLKLSDECINKINQYFSHLKGVGLDFPERNK